MRLLRDLSSGTVLPLDNMNDYYDPALKRYRLTQIEKAAADSPAEHVFIEGSLNNQGETPLKSGHVAGGAPARVQVPRTVKRQTPHNRLPFLRRYLIICDT